MCIWSFFLYLLCFYTGWEGYIISLFWEVKPNCESTVVLFWKFSVIHVSDFLPVLLLKICLVCVWISMVEFQGNVFLWDFENSSNQATWLSGQHCVALSRFNSLMSWAQPPWLILNTCVFDPRMRLNDLQIAPLRCGLKYPVPSSIHTSPVKPVILI